MKVLGIDTSTNVCSIALLEDDRLLYEHTTNYKRTHSITLMPMIENMFKILESDLSDVDVFAVASGPGSFTGLRIGSATVKSFAHANQKPIVAVSTLEVLANNITYTNGLICPLVDARKGNVYYQFFEYRKEKCVPISEMKIEHISNLMNELNELDRKVIFVGDGVKENLATIEELDKNQYVIVSPNNNIQRGSSVAVLGSKYFSEKKVENYLEHSPVYLRKSQAEQALENRK